MTQALKELLFAIRQHEGFQDFLKAVETPPVHEFKPSGDADAQFADYIFRSGRRRQHNEWLQFLIGEPSKQEKP